MRFFTQFPYFWILSFGLSFAWSEASAQQRSVSGTVTDAEQGGTIPGVNVVKAPPRVP